jgi:hypothetical protein
MELEYGEIPIISKLKAKLGTIKGRSQLKATAIMATIWAKRKTKLFPLLKSLSEKSKEKEAQETIAKESPEDFLAITNLKNVEKFLKRGKPKKELKDMLNSPKAISRALIAHIAGGMASEEMEEKTVLEIAGKLASSFETATSPKDAPSKLTKIAEEGQWADSEKRKEEGNTNLYRRLKRAIEIPLKQTNSKPQRSILAKALETVETMLRGSRRLALVLSAREQEAKASVELTETDGYKLRNEEREWALEKQDKTFEFIVSKNQGKPWPPHLDPDTVIEPLRNIVLRGISKPQNIDQDLIIPKTTRKKSEELIDINKSLTTEENESPMELLLKIRGRKNLLRIQKAKSQMQELKRRDENLRRPYDDQEDETTLEIK